MNRKPILWSILMVALVVLLVSSCNKSVSLYLESIPAKYVDEGDELKFSLASYVVATGEKNGLVYEIVSGVGAILGEYYSYTPGFSDAGQHTVKIRISDGSNSVSGSFEVIVRNKNRAPSIDIPNQSMAYSETLTLDLLDFSSDPDGDTLSYSIVSGVGTVTGNTYTYSPKVADIGDHPVTITVNDGNEGSDSASFVISVYNDNNPPEIDIPDQRMAEGENLSLDLLNYAHDEDGDELSFELVSGVGQVAGNTYSYSADYASSGEYTVIIAVTDTKGASDSSEFLLTVDNTNRPPVVPFNPQPSDQETGVPTDTTLSWSCTDPDGDGLLFDVYFGTKSNPPLFAKGVSGTSRSVGTLKPETTYYWKINVTDGTDTVEGPVWTFKTLVPPVFLRISPLQDNGVSPVVEIDGVEYFLPVVYETTKNTTVLLSVDQSQEFDYSPFVPGKDARTEFKGWSDGSGELARNIKMESSLDLFIDFDASYYLRTSTSPPNLADVDGAGWYPMNSKVEITAPDVEEFKFSHWDMNNHDRFSVSRIIVIEMNEPKNLVAYYTHICP